MLSSSLMLMCRLSQLKKFSQIQMFVNGFMLSFMSPPFFDNKRRRTRYIISCLPSLSSILQQKLAVQKRDLVFLSLLQSFIGELFSCGTAFYCVFYNAHISFVRAHLRERVSSLNRCVKEIYVVFGQLNIVRCRKAKYFFRNGYLSTIFHLNVTVVGHFLWFVFICR